MKTFIEIQQKQTDVRVLDYTNKPKPSFENWKKEELWVLVETKNDWEAWSDLGYGSLALFNTITKELHYTRNGHTLQSNDSFIILMSADYFCTKYWLYQHTES